MRRVCRPNSTRRAQTARRSRVRNGGVGLCLREALHGPAAIGALAKTVRRPLPNDVDGGILNGNLTAIVDAVGRGSFDDGHYDLSRFLASRSRNAAYLASRSRHAAYLASWRPDAQSYAIECGDRFS